LKFAVEVGTKVTKFKEYYNAMVWDFRILTRENKDGAYYLRESTLQQYSSTILKEK